MAESSGEPRFVSAAVLLDKLFTEILTAEEFDSEIVALTKDYLGIPAPHSKAGSGLAEAVINLAKKRTKGVSK